MTRDNTLYARARRLLAVLALLAAPALAAAEPLYDVEVIIFSSNTGGDDEVMTPAEGGIRTPGTLTGGETTVLPAGEYRLNNIRGGLAVARGYHVLYHNAWRQPAYDRGRSVDFPVHANGGLDGSVTLIKERYLHLDVDLLLGTGGGPVYRLDEKRRIRSGELHYFDHPRFGMIALVTPYDAVEEPAAAEPEPAGEAGGGAGEEEPVPADDQLTR